MLTGKGIDLHKALGKLPRPKIGFTLPGHNYTGPYNPLEEQLEHDETGNILKFNQNPTGKTDAIAAQHDVDYTICSRKKSTPKEVKKCKNEADRKMVRELDKIPWKEKQWGHTAARNIINWKQKLGMGLTVNEKKILKEIHRPVKKIFHVGR